MPSPNHSPPHHTTPSSHNIKPLHQTTPPDLKTLSHPLSKQTHYPIIKYPYTIHPNHIIPIIPNHRLLHYGEILHQTPSFPSNHHTSISLFPNTIRNSYTGPSHNMPLPNHLTPLSHYTTPHLKAPPNQTTPSDLETLPHPLTIPAHYPIIQHPYTKTPYPLTT